MADGGRRAERDNEIAEALDRPAIEPGAADMQQVDRAGCLARRRVVGALRVGESGMT